MTTFETYAGPRPADLVERALAEHGRRPWTGEQPPAGEFVIEWLTARGVLVRPIDMDEVPDSVCEAVADVVAPDELGGPDSSTSDLVHRVMRTAYAATCAHLATQPNGDTR